VEKLVRYTITDGWPLRCQLIRRRPHCVVMRVCVHANDEWILSSPFINFFKLFYFEIKIKTSYTLRGEVEYNCIRARSDAPTGRLLFWHRVTLIIN